MPTLDQLSGPIEDVYSWNLDAQGRFTGTLLGFVERSYADEDINHYHPLLAESWRAYFRHQSRLNKITNTMPKEHAIASLQLLLYGAIEFVDIYDRQCSIVGIDYLYKEDDHPMVSIRGSLVTAAEESLSSGQSVPYITSYLSSGIHVFKPSLEKYFPGWEERWAICTELGLGLNELTRHTFTQAFPPNIQVSLTDFQPC